MPDLTDTLLISLENGVRLIKFNNTKKKNAIPLRDFLKVQDVLQEDENNDSVVVTIFTGNGDYFTSGIQLDTLEISNPNIFKEGIELFINYPKLLIAVVNGPAVGYGTCSLPLYDIVYASERATFSTPFLKLQCSPDLCVSYTFPRLMGKSLAWEVLFLGRILSAEEALRANLVSTVVPHQELDALMTKLLKFGSLPVNLIKTFKKLFNKPLEQKLFVSNKEEMDAFIDCIKRGAFTQSSQELKNKSKL